MLSRILIRSSSHSYGTILRFGRLSSSTISASLTNDSITNKTDEESSDNEYKKNSIKESVPISGSSSRSEYLRKADYRRYYNYAPTLFQWSQQIVSGEMTLETLTSSPKYQEVSKAICDTTRHSDKNILNLLKSLVIMRIDPESRLVQFLENELLFKIEHFDIKMLINAYQVYQLPAVATSSPLRGQIVDSLNRNINDRLDSVNASFFEIIQLIKQSRNFTPEILIKIEDQATQFLDSTEDISLDHLCYLIVLLSRHNRRSKLLIRAAVSKLIKFRSEDIYSMPPHLVHMISSLNRLNFPEINLLEKCSDILMNLDFLEKINDSARRDFIVAISQFNFFYTKLVDYYLNKLIEKPEIFKRQDLITLTITIARLNYNTDEIQEILLSKVIPQLPNLTEFISKMQYFNFVYSLVLLRIAPIDYLRQICNKEFLASLEADEAESYLLKLRGRAAKINEFQKELNQEYEVEVEENENTAEVNVSETEDIYNVINLRRKFLVMSGLLLREESGKALKDVFEDESKLNQFEQFVHSLEFEPVKRSKDMQSFRDNIFRSLDSFAPIGKFTSIDKKLPYGFSIDAELLVDSSGQPKPLNTSENTTGYHKIAVMCIGFNDTILDSSSQLIGPKYAEIRILRSLGYVVLPVHQNVIPAGTTSLNRVKFLQDLISSNLRELANKSESSFDQ
ncbi:Cell cycle progression [Blomia tropicalis]|nr:Cell cycle progression [Blomia tropicalis]